jgi:Polyketide cyclase / dehydrase and lipid transport
MQVTVAASGDADADLAWERYARPALWPTWSPQILGVECSDERIVAGSTGTVHGPLGLRVRFEVLSVDDAGRRWSWRVHAPLGVTLRLDHVVEVGRPSGSRTTLTVHGLAPLALGYAPLAWPALKRLVKA